MLDKNRKPAIIIGVTIDRSVKFHSKLALALKKEGFEVHLVSSGGPNTAQLSQELFTHDLYMKRNPSPLSDIASFVRWINLVRSIRPDVVMVGTPKASLLGLLSSRLMRVPTRIYFVHGLRLETTSGPFRMILLAMEKFAFACASIAVAVSPSVRDKILNLDIAAPKKVAVLGAGSAQGVDLEMFRPNKSSAEKSQIQKTLGLDPSLPTIGFVGRLTTDKGIAELRDALLNLNGRGIKLQVLLVGSAEDQLGAKIVAELRTSGIRVCAPGRVKDPWLYFRSMDIFCLPTHREGLGAVILESFASEVPVVSTKVTGVVDLVDDQKTGLLVPPHDAEALSQSIELLITDPELAHSLKKAARDYVVKNYNSHDVVEKQKKFLLQQVEKARC